MNSTATNPVIKPTYDTVAVVTPHPRRVHLLHSGMTLDRFFSLHVAGAMLPITAGLLLYGWRGVAVMAAVTGSAFCSILIWRNIGARGRQMRPCHGMWLALLLSLMLPAHLASAQPPFPGYPGALWAVPIGAGILVTFLAWLLGGVGSGRVHPALVTYLVLVVLFGNALMPHWVLQRNHLGTGDAAKAADLDTFPSAAEGWINLKHVPDRDALSLRPAAERLIQFTTGRYTAGQKSPSRSWLSLVSLLRDEMPPLEDLIAGGQPGPFGASSAIAVIVGGLFLLYRGVIDFRIPVLIVAAAMAAFMVLPIPVLITENGAMYRWLIPHDAAVGAAAALTFANYEILAGPLLLTAFFLATAPAVRPMARRARVIYALLVGLLAAFLQLYVSVSYGAYVALLLVSVLTPIFDKMFKPNALV
jgi:Na+-translocating ferredoxin:NAD+ oxidoreductase RnfD subunit